MYIFISIFLIGLIYYLVFWILVLTFYFFFIIILIFLCMNHRAKLFLTVSSKEQNPCKIDPREKLTLRAKVTPCKNVPSCKKDPSCKFIFVQFCALVQEWLRAILSSYNFVPSCNFVSSYNFVRLCIFDCDPKYLATPLFCIISLLHKKRTFI